MTKFATLVLTSILVAPLMPMVVDEPPVAATQRVPVSRPLIVTGDHILRRTFDATDLVANLNPSLVNNLQPWTISAMRVSKVSFVYGASSVRLGVSLPGVTRGSVTFRVNTRVMCTAPVKTGTAACRPSSTLLNAGKYLLVARYTGNTNLLERTSTASLLVTPARSELSVHASTSTLLASTPSSLKVTATLRSSTGPKPPGSVALSWDGHVLSSNIATFSFAKMPMPYLTVGSHVLTATYRGSRDFTAAVSHVVIRVSGPIQPTPGLAPTFGSVTATATGFTAQISDFDPAFTWSVSASASGVATIDAAGLVTVTGVAYGASSTLTVTTSRAGYTTDSATVTSSPVLVPDAAVLTSVSGADGAMIDDTAHGAGFIAQYYSPNDRWLQYYVDAGATISMTWHVTGTHAQPLANTAVTLIDNLAYANSSGTTWNVSGLNANPNGVLSGTTDALGNVSFTFTNTNSSSGNRPSDTTTASGAEANESVYPWSRFVLEVGSDVFTANPNTTVNQATDLVDLIVIPPASSAINYDVSHGAMLWSENFNDPAGSPPNSLIWTPVTGSGTYGTGEIENNTTPPANASEDGSGNLTITATCTTSCANPVFGSSWTSSRLWTRNKVNFQYGQLEARIKMPAGAFNWPAFWMLGANYNAPVAWPMSGEIDIAEGLAGNSVDQATLHANYPNSTTDWNGGGGVTLRAPLSNISAGFHNYGILWTPTSISFILDGNVWGSDVYNASAGTITQTLGSTVSTFSIGGQVWPFDQPFFAIFDDAIPAGTSAANGSTGKMVINWIHYYSYNGFGQTSP